MALNPNGLVFSGRSLNDTMQRIVLLQGPTAGSAALTALLQHYYPAYSGAAIQAAEKFACEAMLCNAVLGTPYSLSVTALVGQMMTDLQLASIVPDRGSVAVAPSQATAKACTSNVIYDPTSKGVILLSSSSSPCYPLLLTLYISLPRQCPTMSPTTARTVAFLLWMFTEDTLEASLDALNLASLTGVSSAIRAANEEALFQLSCQVRPVPATTTNIVPLLLAVIIPIAVVVLVGVALCGWWLWRVMESNRALRKKFSNDNVAESCAEAIARFDLAAVAWLREVKEPNKIQRAFLAIVGLLEEVKPFIPDQLLSHLVATNKVDVEEDDYESEGQSERSVSLACDSNGRWRSSRSRRSRSQSLNHSLQKHNASTAHLTTRSSLTCSSEGSNKVVATKDWKRKRCTYMCVRFGSTDQNAEKRLVEMVVVAGRIVDIAKANGATIDAVGVNFINVHWGATSSSCGLAARAVHAGLEVTNLRDTLPEEQRSGFWLQIGIGKGLCDCGTINSDSGHRFFVVWGPEPSLAIEVAMASLPRRVLTSLLVTPAVQQEVQFTVQCMPRLWHNNVLLWEPLPALRKEGEGEWMYELQKINEGSSLSSKTLLEAFLMVKGETSSPADVSAHVANLRAQYVGNLSPQDTASLDLLLTTGCIHSSPSWDTSFDASIDAN
eukprot:GGOE01035308.1.p1 GENE.GGOE01035308.1~~GGOE01035308.1.p1  ORF type:complete len:666 (-),score=215.29 GGOE01035308.1:927-2924(-)